MKYQISIYNEHTGQKEIRYIIDAARVPVCYNKVYNEIKNKAFDVVLIELATNK